MRQIIVVLSIIGILLLAGCASLSDPFGSNPKGTSPNCGPENRYKFDVTIESKQEFINFLQSHDGEILDQYGNNQFRLDNFKDIKQGMNYTEMQSAEIDWDNVMDAIKIDKVFRRTIYILDYNPFMCSGYTLKMTNDGHVSVYGCCGY